MSDTPIQNVPKEISELGICLIQHPVRLGEVRVCERVREVESEVESEE